ncbi:hypothetical protein AAFF_G00317110 [Aldrovandia affinis]|uniref:G-protein coupled receptors family 1 profile domain-containing protein n=1 Tax=Aldrovandia affinis TaxID=143900 RepID=A0AAD7W0W5_9TELE|nr:hypothetical protein AAFF_G00317110 [Aldrovandia affinis]
MDGQQHWMVTLQGIFYPTLAAVGIPSNILTFLVFWKRNCLLSRSSAFYLMAIAAADTAVLVLIVVLELTLKYHVEQPYWSREPWCSLRDIFNYGAYNASTWLVVGLTVERFAAIRASGVRAWLCSPRCAARAIGAIVLLGHLCAVPYYWSNRSVYSERDRRWACVYSEHAGRPYVHTLVWFQTALVFVVPFVIIFVLNGLTLRLIAHSNRVRAASVAAVATVSAKTGPGAWKALHLLHPRRRKSVVLLVAVSMSFTLLSITRFVTQVVLRTTDFYTVDRDDYSLRVNIAADVGTMLSLSNAAINMLLHACTQPRFRREVAACVRLAFSRTSRPCAALTAGRRT